MAADKPHGAWVFTSNVDGHFQKAGFPIDRVCEIHGSIHHLQCTAGCDGKIWSADTFEPDIDSANCRLLGELPHCPRCGAPARPNILMFGDWSWIERRTALQLQRIQQWLAGLERPVCIEIGAGTHIPTVRNFSERYGTRLIRINPTEAETPPGGIGMTLGGEAGIAALHQAFGSG